MKLILNNKIGLIVHSLLILYFLFSCYVLIINGGNVSGKPLLLLFSLSILTSWLFQLYYAKLDFKLRIEKKKNLIFYLISSLIGLGMTTFGYYILTISFAIQQLFGGGQFQFDEVKIASLGIGLNLIAIIYFTVSLIFRIRKAVQVAVANNT